MLAIALRHNKEVVELFHLKKKPTCLSTGWLNLRQTKAQACSAKNFARAFLQIAKEL
jgi:hypothetical protein